MTHKPLLSIFCFLLWATTMMAQPPTFQRLLPHGEHVQSQDVVALSDGGYAFVGISDNGSGSDVLLTKISCDGQEEWSLNLGSSSTINNIFPEVIQCANGDIAGVHNVGQFQSYTSAIFRVSLDGTILWKRRFGGVRDDRAHAFIQLADGGFLVGGVTNSQGTDTNGSLSFTDIFHTRLNADGTIGWYKTYGNSGSIEGCYGLYQDGAGLVYSTGRYLVGGTFYTYLMKMDVQGNVFLFKGYGAPNHRTYGYDVIVDDVGNMIMTGSTTIAKVNFQSSPDVFLIRTDFNGNVEYARIYEMAVGDDRSESGSSITFRDGGFAIGVPTMSFTNFSSGFVPNKNAVYLTNNLGEIDRGILYNQGGSHYTRLNEATDGGFALSNFTNFYPEAVNFTPLIIKTDSNFDSGCNQIEVGDQIAVTNLTWDVQDIDYFTFDGINEAEYALNSGFVFDNLVTLCEDLPPASVAAFELVSVPDCPNGVYEYQSISTGTVVSYFWLFGDGETSDEANPSHTFTEPGTYTVQLIINDGCLNDTASAEITIPALPSADVDLSICEGESVLINGQEITQSGLYQDTLSNGLCDSLVNITLTVDPLGFSSQEIDLCPGDTLIIGGEIVTDDGTYEEIISTNGCDSIVANIVRVLVLPVNEQIDTTICEGESILFGNQLLSEEQVYNVTIDCEFIQPVNVTLSSCYCALEMPNVFTPNNDSRNDLFRPFYDCEGDEITSFSMTIFNRWGEEIFQTDNLDQGWDGTTNDEPLPADVYMFVMEYEVAGNTAGMFQEKGEVALVR